MDFLRNFFGSPTSPSTWSIHTFNVKCDRCGEIIAGRVNLANDLSLDDDSSGYFVRKVLMGSGHCFQQIEMELKFDTSKQLTGRHAHGGTFIE